MRVEYVDHFGTDLTVVNAARVSLDKHHEDFQASDEGLIKYLAAHGHWTPFSHPTICLRVTVPIFVANQLKRHVVGLTLNEVSRRYVDSEPEFYITDKLGARAENKKQGAKENEFVTELKDEIYPEATHSVFSLLDYVNKEALANYNYLLENGVAPEDARMVLPLSLYTSWYWTGSLYAFARVYSLRAKPDAQRQTQEVAHMISAIVEPLFPFSWSALCQKDGS